jgi:hypothetical protein
MPKRYADSIDYDLRRLDQLEIITEKQGKLIELQNRTIRGLEETQVIYDSSWNAFEEIIEDKDATLHGLRRENKFIKIGLLTTAIIMLFIW